jgi:hypothetical protein
MNTVIDLPPKTRVITCQEYSYKEKGNIGEDAYIKAKLNGTCQKNRMRSSW